MTRTRKRTRTRTRTVKDKDEDKDEDAKYGDIISRKPSSRHSSEPPSPERSSDAQGEGHPTDMDAGNAPVPAPSEALDALPGAENATPPFHYAERRGRRGLRVAWSAPVPVVQDGWFPGWAGRESIAVLSQVAQAHMQQPSQGEEETPGQSGPS